MQIFEKFGRLKSNKFIHFFVHNISTLQQYFPHTAADDTILSKSVAFVSIVILNKGISWTARYRTLGIIMNISCEVTRQKAYNGT
jgi:hypothetical protein